MGCTCDGSHPVVPLSPALTSFLVYHRVFVLLETIYRSFDKIAKHRHVFKVETIGDCYVAVCGLPEPNEDHAVAMARFARDCLGKMDDLTRKLEVTLGTSF
jgi:class 3 adenylate cyclase